jgi:hypothetical protein
METADNLDKGNALIGEGKTRRRNSSRGIGFTENKGTREKGLNESME